MKIMNPDIWGDGSVSPTISFSEERNLLKKRLFELEQELNRQRGARKWYLIVIVLLYVGLLASFSLNVSLLLRKPQTRIVPDINNKEGCGPGSQLPPRTTADPLNSTNHNLDNNNNNNNNMGFAYTTPCLVAVPCESGLFFDCLTGQCRACPQGTYQPHWGQTSCWPCPTNTTTDTPGSSGLGDCKQHDCPFHTKDGLGIMESPNFPRQFPRSVSCRWRIRPGHTKRVLLILPQLNLPSDCSSKLEIRREAETIFSACQSRDQPLIMTGHSGSLWIEFKSGDRTAEGFQLTALSIEDELGYLVDAVLNSGEISSFDQSGHSSLTQDDKILLSRLLLLLNPTYPSSYEGTGSNTDRRRPVIEVLEENENNKVKHPSAIENGR